MNKEISNTMKLMMCGLAIAINIVLGIVMAMIKFPVYLDTIGTIFIAIYFGPWYGAAVGGLTNFLDRDLKWNDGHAIYAGKYRNRPGYRIYFPQGEVYASQCSDRGNHGWNYRSDYWYADWNRRIWRTYGNDFRCGGCLA